MAILVEELEDSSMQNADLPSVDDLLDNLSIPSAYARYNTIEEESTLSSLAAWKSRALSDLQQLRTLLTQLTTDIHDTARLILTVVPFTSASREWTSSSLHSTATSILSTISPTPELLEEIFAHQLKPIFAKTPHPLLNADTGRKLSRPLGGPLAAQDLYEGQVWKSYPGIGEVVLWCVERVSTEMYERMWFLIVPPAMTLLDDYEIAWKIDGVRVARALVHNAPPELLKRTGVSDLLYESFKRAMTLLHEPQTPLLLRLSTSTAISLILATTPEGSEARYNRLCGLLGDGIIGSAWMHASREPETIQASIEVLPEIVDALGIGAVRYLKALVPQLCHPLLPDPARKSAPQLQLASLHALSCVTNNCAPRIHKWKGAIFAAIASCVVLLDDAEKAGKPLPEAHDLRGALREAYTRLESAAPDVRKDYERVHELDARLFDEVLPLPVVVGT
ncbi:unnamed protein product [Peniophora sp. CBMAI 1063]|nr:unnamed protein product [Peniophora sp. CBMAI 1063]